MLESWGMQADKKEEAFPAISLHLQAKLGKTTIAILETFPFMSHFRLNATVVNISPPASYSPSISLIALLGIPVYSYIDVGCIHTWRERYGVVLDLRKHEDSCLLEFYSGLLYPPKHNP